MTDRSIGHDVWAGNHWGRDGAIARAKREYRRTSVYLTDDPPQESVDAKLTYVNALYSALGREYPRARRGNPSALAKASVLLMRLRPFYRAYRDRAEKNDLTGFTADQCEMLGAQLVKYAGIPFLGGPRYLAAAETYAFAGTVDSEYPHTQSLAYLTLARASLIRAYEGMARDFVKRADRRIRLITDPNQKARVLRSCAELWHELGEHTRAAALIAQAEEVPGIAEDVRAKVAEVKRAIGIP